MARVYVNDACVEDVCCDFHYSCSAERPFLLDNLLLSLFFHLWIFPEAVTTRG